MPIRFSQEIDLFRLAGEAEGEKKSDSASKTVEEMGETPPAPPASPANRIE